MATKEKENLHIAMFPWLAYGHIKPFFEFSMFLSTKGHKISFISTPKNIERLSNDLVTLERSGLLPSASINLIEIPLPHVPGLPESAESTSELPSGQVPYLKKAYDRIETDLTQFLADSSVDWIVFDFVPYWLPKVATTLGIKSVFFSVFNATGLAFLGSPEVLLKGRCEAPEDLITVPRWMDYRTTVRYKLHEVLSHKPCMDDVSDFYRFGAVIDGCNFVAIKSCMEFESEALSVLHKIYDKPIVPLGVLPSISQDDKRDNRWIDLKSWLDSKEQKSVFYVALGTEVALGQDLMYELAHGIEKSELPFIWVVKDRPTINSSEELNSFPCDFANRIKDRGFIWRGWAPQTMILAHDAIGGFLTHCGWNSTIEALSHGRALILFSGGSSDQGLMARFLNDKRVGLEVPRDEQTGSFTSDTVAKMIRQIMVEKEGEQIRENAWGMKEIFGNIELQNKHLNAFAKVLEEDVTT